MRSLDWLRMLIWPAVIGVGLLAALFLIRIPEKLEEIDKYEQRALANPARKVALEQAAAEHDKLTPQQIDELFGPGAAGRLAAEISSGQGVAALTARGLNLSATVPSPTPEDFGLWWEYVPEYLAPLLPRGALVRTGDPTQTLDTCMAFLLEDQVLWFHCKEDWLARAALTTTKDVYTDYAKLYNERSGVPDSDESALPSMYQPYSRSVRIEGIRIRQFHEYHGTGHWKDVSYDISLAERRVTELLAAQPSAVSTTP